MSQFNNIQNKKDDYARNEINNRLSNFNNSFIPSQPSNNIAKGDNLLGGGVKNYNSPNLDSAQDKSNFKDQINNRMNTFQRNIEIGQKKLPFHNNIRDYTVTMDSKKDVFNNRLSNYNYLSTNIPPDVNQQNQFHNTSFHKTFREDTNKRLEELSPLSRNLGIPMNGVEPPSVPDFNQNLPADNMESPYINYNYQKQFQDKSQEVDNPEVYIKNYESMATNSNLDVKYNSYDASSYGSYQTSPENMPNYASKPNQLYNREYNPQDHIKEFDYSLINNNGMSNLNPPKNDGINQLPKLAVNNNMPVDTRQEFHFHQNYS